MSNKYVDYKVSIWRRAHLDDKVDNKELLNYLQTYGVGNGIPEELGFLEDEVLYDTEEILTSEENNSFPTVEFYDKLDDSGTIYPIEIKN